jgi:hypothetical protein
MSKVGKIALDTEGHEMSEIGKIALDTEGHEIILHDADEAKLAALGKKRIVSRRCSDDRGNGTKFQHLFHAGDVFLYHCNSTTISRMSDNSGKHYLQYWPRH